MRRAFSFIATLLLVLALLPAPARAGGIVNLVLELVADQLEETATFTGGADVFVDLSRVPPSFFADNYAVLDARIDYELSKVVNPNCPPNLTLFQSNASKAQGGRIRRSAAPKSAVQRVATAQPAGRYYLLRIGRASAGDVSRAGPCVSVQDVTYTLRVRLYASTPVSTGLGFAPIHLPEKGDGEPSIAVDANNGDRVYISAPVGIPAAAGGNTGGIDFWRSLDGGNTFTYAQKGNPAGGGDSHVAVDRRGDVFLADLGGAAVYVSKSTDAGRTFVESTPGAINSDRQWLATYTPPSLPAGSDPTKVFLSYHDLGPTNYPWECISIKAGTVFQPACNPMATHPDAVANSFSNTINGNQVFDSAGTVYGVFSSPDLQGIPGEPLNFHLIWLAVSTDGIVFANQLIARTPAGVDVGGLFPVIAVDKADNLYVAWAEHTLPYGPGVIKLAFSRDRGLSWSTPRSVSPTGGFAVLPWIAAGNAGQVEVTWVGTTTPSYNDPTANWYQYMAQSTNVLGAGAFSVFAVSPQPIRYGTICLSGLLCSTEGDDGRILLDFTSNDIDSRCNAHVTYANSGPEVPTAPSSTLTDYARQRSGPNLCTPVPAPPPPCDIDRQADGQGEIGGSSGSRGKFSFQACGRDGQREHADYSDADAKVNFHSTSYTAVVHNAATHTVTLNGTGTNGDHLVTFVITASDNGLSGLTDVFRIALSDGYQRGGTLAVGKVVVR